MTTENLLYLNLAITGLLAILAIWQFFKLQRLDSIRKHFYSSGLRKNLEFLMTEHDEALAKLFADVSDLNLQTEKIRTLNQNNFQKIGIVRYSQFNEAGNLSFSLVLLNNHDNGFVITSLHARDGVRIYSKEILAGKSKAKLTEEETQALNNATNGTK